jgi:alcohol dehydrogenase class IV
VDELQSQLASSGVQNERLVTISREPLVEDVDAAARELRARGGAPGDVIVALGGGSAIDLAKAIAAMAAQPHASTVRDFLEGVGRGLTIDRAPLPVVALPTTAGTGSEATRNAVISSVDPVFKKSLRSERLVPAAVLLDPELTVSCPPTVTAHSGMDAITQLIESLLSRRANAFTQSLCLEGLRRALPALPVAFEDGGNREARESMQYAAFLSGVALANSGLGLAHGVAAALGVHCDVPHGLACAVLLPAAMRFNRDVRATELASIGRLLPGCGGCSDDDAADAAIEGLERLARRVGIPAKLSALGVRREQIDRLVCASHGNSLSGNPREVRDEDLREILHRLCPND